MGWLGTGLAIALLLAACGGSKGISDERLAELRAEVTGTYARAAAHTCTRALADDPAVEGDAAAEQLQMLRGDGAIEACVDAVRNHPEPLWIEIGKDDDRRPRPLDDPMLEEPELDALLASCAGLAPLVDRVARVSDGCSAVALGRPARRENVIRAISLATSLALVARARARAGELGDAVELLLDGIVAYDTMSRGWIDLLHLMAFGSSQEILWSALRSVLDAADGRLEAAAIDRAARRLDALLAAPPAIGLVMETDRFTTMVDLTVIHAEPASWAPPDGRPAPDGETRGARVSQHMWSGMSRLLADERLACPLDATPRACLDGLNAFVDQHHDKLYGPAIMPAIVTQATKGYTKKFAAAQSRAVAVRIQLEVMRGGAEPACPDDAALAGLLASKTLGELRLERGPDQLLVRMPAWIGLLPDAPLARIRCGSAPSPAPN